MKEIYAQYDGAAIRVYQAYRAGIAEEAVRLQAFGEQFSRTRMTWIKPSFLWMMYRAGWGAKKDQEHILAIDLDRGAFETLLRQAVLTSPCGKDPGDWRQALDASPVRVQWDPDRKPDGTPIGRPALQMGIKAAALSAYLDGIVRITDITPQVHKWDAQRHAGRLDKAALPSERIYPMTDPAVRARLAMDE
jgi:hypothetical protein